VSGHPWIVDDAVAPDKPIDSAVLSRLKHFSAMNKLKKMALRVRLLNTLDMITDSAPLGSVNPFMFCLFLH
jgi:hypothetical protein